MKYWKQTENEKYEPLILRTVLLKDIRYLYFLFLAGYSVWIITDYNAKVLDKMLQDPFFWISIPVYIYVFWALRKIVEKFKILLRLYPETSKRGGEFKRTIENFISSPQVRLFENATPVLFILLFIIYWHLMGLLGTAYDKYSPPWSIASQIAWLIFFGIILFPIFVSFIIVVTGVLKGIKKLEQQKLAIAESLLSEDKFSLIILKQELKPIIDFVSTIATYSGIYVIIWNVGVFYVNLKILQRIDYTTYFLGGFGILFVIIVLLASYHYFYQIMSETKEQLLTRHSMMYDEIAKKYFERLNDVNNNKETAKQNFRNDLEAVRNIIADLEKSSTIPFESGIIYRLLLLNSSSFIFPILEIGLRIIFKLNS